MSLPVVLNFGCSAGAAGSEKGSARSIAVSEVGVIVLVGASGFAKGCSESSWTA